MFYFDVPLVHEENNYGYKFIEACAKTERVQIFETLPVQALINRHWNYVKWWLVLTCQIPYII